MKRILTIILTLTAISLATVFALCVSPVKANSAVIAGTKIAYSCFTGNPQNGQLNICVMNGDGSGMIQITDPLTINAYSPRLDQDAGKILYLPRTAVSQGNLRYRLAVVNADGTGARILFDGEQYDANDYSVNTAGFSPDGSKIVFVTYPRNGNSYARVLWVINTDGTGLTQLYAGNIFAGFPFFTNGLQQSLGLQYISFSPDGSKVVVSISSETTFTGYEVFSVNLNGSGVTQLTSTTDPAIAVDPVFSPDGNKIVFNEAVQEGLYRLVVMNADGSGRTVLTEEGKNFQASFSPDSSNIVFNTTRNAAVPNSFDSYDVYTINTDGTNLTRLTFNSGNTGKSGLPSFSPFGDQIVFNYTPSGFQALEIYVMNANGSGLTVLTDSPGDASAMNPTYANPDLDGDGVVNSIDNCRLVSNPNQLNTDGDGQGNACDADDDNDGIADEFDNCSLTANQYRIAFWTTVTGTTNSEIYTQNLDGTNQIRLTNDGANDLNPSFNRSRTQIVWESLRAGRYEIYKMNADGTGTIRLTNIAGGNNSPVFSPDGSKIALKTISFKSVNDTVRVIGSVALASGTWTWSGTSLKIRKASRTPTKDATRWFWKNAAANGSSSPSIIPKFRTTKNFSKRRF